MAYPGRGARPHSAGGSERSAPQSSRPGSSNAGGIKLSAFPCVSRAARTVGKCTCGKREWISSYCKCGKLGEACKCRDNSDTREKYCNCKKIPQQNIFSKEVYTALKTRGGPLWDRNGEFSNADDGEDKDAQQTNSFFSRIGAEVTSNKKEEPPKIATELTVKKTEPPAASSKLSAASLPPPSDPPPVSTTGGYNVSSAAAGVTETVVKTGVGATNLAAGPTHASSLPSSVSASAGSAEKKSNDASANAMKATGQPPSSAAASTNGKASDVATSSTSPAGQTLKITIVSARGLRNADWSISGNDKSDPYCICLIPSKPKSKIQTLVIDNTLDPKWNFSGDIIDYAPGVDSLEFLVYDKDTLKKDDFLGKVTLNSSQFHPGGFAGELKIADAGKGIDAYLKIEVAAAAGSKPTSTPAPKPTVGSPLPAKALAPNSPAATPSKAATSSAPALPPNPPPAATSKSSASSTANPPPAAASKAPTSSGPALPPNPPSPALPPNPPSAATSKAATSKASVSSAPALSALPPPAAASKGPTSSGPALPANPPPAAGYGGGAPLPPNPPPAAATKTPTSSGPALPANPPPATASKAPTSSGPALPANPPPAAGYGGGAPLPPNPPGAPSKLPAAPLPPAPPATASTKSSQKAEHVVGPDVKSIGLRFTGFPPKQVAIEKITPDTWAAGENSFKVGDIVAALNGKRTDAMTEDEFKKAMGERPLRIQIG